MGRYQGKGTSGQETSTGGRDMGGKNTRRQMGKIQREQTAGRDVGALGKSMSSKKRRREESASQGDKQPDDSPSKRHHKNKTALPKSEGSGGDQSTTFFKEEPRFRTRLQL